MKIVLRFCNKGTSRFVFCNAAESEDHERYMNNYDGYNNNL